MKHDGSSLVVAVGSRACAIPIAHVVETMRPLPIERIRDAPRFVTGVSIVRGAPVAVVDLGALVGAGSISPKRFVLLRLGNQRLVLAVESVLAVRALVDFPLETMPPILGEAAASVVEAVGALDARLLVVLRAMRILPDGWRPTTLHEAGA